MPRRPLPRSCSEDPQNAAAYGGLVRAHIAMGEIDQAEAILNGAPAEISQAPRSRPPMPRSSWRAGRQCRPGGELRAKVEADPDDHQARFDLALALHAHGEVEAAVDELLELFRRDREWNDGAAKAQLFTIFDALQPKDPIALNGRRKLSSMIFA
jgi:putative thioredoxin